MKKKILYITPHLSTGGLPQYLYKKIEKFSNEYDIWCIEWRNLSDQYVVQKEKIKSLLSDRLITLGGNDNREIHEKSPSLLLPLLIKQINDISPDIIHFEEIPETFINTDILQKIFTDNRPYKILVTTHSSQTKPSEIKFTADKFVLVSEWSLLQFKSFFGDSIPLDVWEYPIEKVTYNKEEYKTKLGFESDWKHILNVGLFTPGKNQAELVNLAKKFDEKNLKVKFHFVGNLAINFKDYWEPIQKDLPKNCVIHGEKDNVEDFYKASDAFYFTSNLELNPLVVKEALSYGLKTYIKNLATYLNSYDGLCHYISGDIESDFNNLLTELQPDKFESQLDDETLVIVLSHANTAFRQYLLQNSTSEIESKKLLVSNYPVDNLTQSLFDWTIYQKENPILKKEEFSKYTIAYRYFNIDKSGNKNFQTFEFEHGFAVYQMMQISIKFAKSFGFKKLHFINYDFYIPTNILIRDNKLLSQNPAVVYSNDGTWENPSFSTGYFCCNIEWIEEFLTKWQTKEEYYTFKPYKILEDKFTDFINQKKVYQKKLQDLNGIAKLNQEGLLQFSKSKGEKNIFQVIANKYGCDKTLFHEYHKIYPQFFNDIRFEEFNLLEIGIDQGKSVNLWEEFFPKASIWGMDIGKEFLTKRGKVFSLDQSNLEHLKQICKDVPKCQIIVDDGSHIAEHQLKTFFYLFDNLLLPGGIYILEDIECSYWEPQRTLYSYETGYLNIVDYFTQLNHQINWRYGGPKNTHNILSITFGPNCIVVKKENTE